MTKYAGLLAAAQAATPGPWVEMHKPAPSYSDHGYRLVCRRGDESQTGVYALASNMVVPGRGFVIGRDISYFAAANPAVILDLLSEREQLREALKNMDDAFCSQNDTREERHQSRLALIAARAALALGEQP